MKDSTGAGRAKAPKTTARGQATARKAMMATSGRKGRLTGYKAAKELQLNKSAVAKKARGVDAATSAVKPGLKKKVVTSSVTSGKVNAVSKKQQARTRDLVVGAASLTGVGAGVRGASALSNAMKIAPKVKDIRIGGAAWKSVMGSNAPAGAKAAATKAYKAAVTNAERNQARGLLTKSEASKMAQDALLARASRLKMASSKAKKK